MVEEDHLARWIVGLAEGEQPDEQAGKFLECARVAWPRVLAHARRELSGRKLNADEITSLALEIWEATLRSVWRTWRRERGFRGAVADWESYLIGSFHHRLNRRLKQKRLRDSVIQFHAPEDLEAIQDRTRTDDYSGVQIHRELQLEQVYSAMTPNMRRALVARVYGYSWSEIAKKLDVDEQNLIMRVRYAIRKVRSKMAGA